MMTKSIFQQLSPVSDNKVFSIGPFSPFGLGLMVTQNFPILLCPALMRVLPVSCQDLVRNWENENEMMQKLKMGIAFGNGVKVCTKKTRTSCVGLLFFYNITRT